MTWPLLAIIGAQFVVIVWLVWVIVAGQARQMQHSEWVVRAVKARDVHDLDGARAPRTQPETVPQPDGLSSMP